MITRYSFAGVTVLDLIIIVVVVLVILFICCPLAIVIIVICCVCIFATNRHKLKLTNKTTIAKSDTFSTTKFETPYSLLPVENDSSQRDQTDSQSQSANQQSEFNSDSINACTDQQQQSHVDTDSVGDRQPLYMNTDPAKPTDDQQQPSPLINDRPQNTENRSVQQP